MSAFDQMQNSFNVVSGVGGDEDERYYQRERKRNYNVNLSYAQHAESHNLQRSKPTRSYGFRHESKRSQNRNDFGMILPGQEKVKRKVTNSGPHPDNRNPNRTVRAVFHAVLSVETAIRFSRLTASEQAKTCCYQLWEQHLRCPHV